MKTHGVEYASKAEAEARIAEINTEIFQSGVSDGRVTEILCIIDMLQKEGLEEAPEQPKPPVDWSRVLDRYKPTTYYVFDETAGIIISAWNNEIYAEERAMDANRYQRTGPDAHEYYVTTNPTPEEITEYEESGRGW
jgi:hypothetical protein